MILKLENISKYYPVEKGLFETGSKKIKALDEVSLSVNEFETLGVVGESGSGKTTLAKIILNLIAPSSGRVLFNPDKITRFRKDVQIIFQNPYNSLDPKMRVSDIIAEPLKLHAIVPRQRIEARVIELLKMAGLDKDILGRYPFEFSGGQRQRICIARAIASEPKFMVLDEPISSLDLTVQSQMIDLFLALKRKFGLTYIFISHNLAVIKHLADSVAVMREGRVVEKNDTGSLFSSPVDDYTKLLLSSVS